MDTNVFGIVILAAVMHWLCGDLLIDFFIWFGDVLPAYEHNMNKAVSMYRGMWWAFWCGAFTILTMINITIQDIKRAQ